MDFNRWVNKQVKEINDGYKEEEEKKLAEEAYKKRSTNLGSDVDDYGDIYSDMYAIPGISLEESSGLTQDSKMSIDITQCNKEVSERNAKYVASEMMDLMRLDDDYDIMDSVPSSNKGRIG